MKIITLKVRQKNAFEYQLKRGAKVVDKIQAVAGGWYVGCKIHDTLDLATEYARNSAEERACAFGDAVKVVLSS